MILSDKNQSIIVSAGSSPSVANPTFLSSFENCGDGHGQSAHSGAVAVGSTDYTLVPAPSQSESIEVEGFILCNGDSGSNTFVISLLVDTTKYTLWTGTLGSKDTLMYADGSIHVLDSTGRLKSSQTIALTLADGDNLALGTVTGTKIGTSVSQKLGFWNATPVVQPASASQAAVVTTAATQTTPYGFATQAQADALVTLVNALRTALVNIGAIKGAA